MGQSLPKITKSNCDTQRGSKGTSHVPWSSHMIINDDLLCFSLPLIILYIYIYIRRVVNYSWYMFSHFSTKVQKSLHIYIYVDVYIYAYNCVYIYICHILTFLIVKVKSPHFRKPRDAGAEDKVGLTQFHSPGFGQGLEFEQCMLYRIIAQYEY